MNIVEVLKTQASEQPQSVAVIAPKRENIRSLTFRKIEQASSQAATSLSQAGLSAGDAVLVFQPMSADLYIALLAIFRLKLVAVFIDPSAGRRHIERCCKLIPPKALIASPKAHVLQLLSPALRRIPNKFSTGFRLPGTKPWDRWKRCSEKRDIEPCEHNTPALITFTSGSTGEPKVAVRTHGFLLAQHRVLSKELRLTYEDKVLGTLPIFVLSHLGSGVTSVMPNADLRRPGFIEAGPIIRQIQTCKVTNIEASPAFFECIVRYCQEHCITLPGLKKIITGGGPVFPRLLDQLQNLAPNAQIVTVYGSTEAEPIAQIPKESMGEKDIQRMTCGKGLLAGPPIKDIHLKIIPDRWGSPIPPLSRSRFEALCLPPGEAGEIVVSGDHVLPGYWKGRGNSETKFNVSETIWHRTGDAGYLDSKGRLWLLGRCIARIEDDRGILYPFSVESAVSQFPGLRRSACLAYKNQRTLAVELEHPDGSIEIADLKAKLSWAAIDRIEVLRRIPVDPRHNSKIDYPALNALLKKRSGKNQHK
ncbi:MAG: AMP-binding protein [Deltaproteobacteria bacterium]|jgi:acyl-CoA synthetase (AMP-forming)/AMP-acid ligase II|nr:AMP-binding protein [Deltaproteobacteria bacterium]